MVLLKTPVLLIIMYLVCVGLCVCVRRSIQKLEELNVGMDDLGEEVQALSLQCNGRGGVEAGVTSGGATDTTLHQDGAGLSSSTPQRNSGQAPVPPPTESPVLPSR